MITNNLLNMKEGGKPKMSKEEYTRWKEARDAEKAAAKAAAKAEQEEKKAAVKAEQAAKKAAKKLERAAEKKAELKAEQEEKKAELKAEQEVKKAAHKAAKLIRSQNDRAFMKTHFPGSKNKLSARQKAAEQQQGAPEASEPLSVSQIKQKIPMSSLAAGKIAAAVKNAIQSAPEVVMAQLESVQQSSTGPLSVGIPIGAPGGPPGGPSNGPSGSSGTIDPNEYERMVEKRRQNIINAEKKKIMNTYEMSEERTQALEQLKFWEERPDEELINQLRELQEEKNKLMKKYEKDLRRIVSAINNPNETFPRISKIRNVSHQIKELENSIQAPTTNVKELWNKYGLTMEDIGITLPAEESYHFSLNNRKLTGELQKLKNTLKKVAELNILKNTEKLSKLNFSEREVRLIQLLLLLLGDELRNDVEIARLKQNIEEKDYPSHLPIYRQLRKIFEFPEEINYDLNVSRAVTPTPGNSKTPLVNKYRAYKNEVNEKINRLLSRQKSSTGKKSKKAKEKEKMSNRVNIAKDVEIIHREMQNIDLHNQEEMLKKIKSNQTVRDIYENLERAEEQEIIDSEKFIAQQNFNKAYGILTGTNTKTSKTQQFDDLTRSILNNIFQEYKIDQDHYLYNILLENGIINANGLGTPQFKEAYLKKLNELRSKPISDLELRRKLYSPGSDVSHVVNANTLGNRAEKLKKQNYLDVVKMAEQEQSLSKLRYRIELYKRTANRLRNDPNTNSQANKINKFVTKLKKINNRNELSKSLYEFNKKNPKIIKLILNNQKSVKDKQLKTELEESKDEFAQRLDVDPSQSINKLEEIKRTREEQLAKYQRQAKKYAKELGMPVSQPISNANINTKSFEAAENAYLSLQQLYKGTLKNRHSNLMKKIPNNLNTKRKAGLQLSPALSSNKEITNLEQQIAELQGIVSSKYKTVKPNRSKSASAAERRAKVAAAEAAEDAKASAKAAAAKASKKNEQRNKSASAAERRAQVAAEEKSYLEGLATMGNVAAAEAEEKSYLEGLATMGNVAAAEAAEAAEAEASGGFKKKSKTPTRKSRKARRSKSKTPKRKARRSKSKTPKRKARRSKSKTPKRKARKSKSKTPRKARKSKSKTPKRVVRKHR
jgi:hypothetical protein